MVGRKLGGVGAATAAARALPQSPSSEPALLARLRLRLAIGDLALVGEALKYELLLFYFVILLSLNCEYLCKVMQGKRQGPFLEIVISLRLTHIALSTRNSS